MASTTMPTLKGLQQAVERMARDQHLREMPSQRAHELLDNFYWQIAASRTLALFREVIR